MEITKKDYYELLFNYSNLKSENELLKKANAGVNCSSHGESTANVTSDQYKSKRPQTALTRDIDKCFRKSVNDINLFKMNPLFDEEDLLEKYNFNLKAENKENTSFVLPSQDDLKSLLNYNKDNHLKFIEQPHTEKIDNFDDLQDDESDEELKDILNKSIQNLKMIKEIKLENNLLNTKQVDNRDSKVAFSKNIKPKEIGTKDKSNSIFNKPVSSLIDKELGNHPSNNRLPTLKLKTTRMKSKDPILLRENK